MGWRRGSFGWPHTATHLHDDVSYRLKVLISGAIKGSGLVFLIDMQSAFGLVVGFALQRVVCDAGENQVMILAKMGNTDGRSKSTAAC